MGSELLTLMLGGSVIGICLVAIFAGWLYMTSRKDDDG
jgi:hypothetical protein